MAAVAQVRGCDGFRVESPAGLLGWVEEAWLGASGDPTALAVRTVDGRRGLLVVDDVETVLPERELLVMGASARLLELDVPRVDDVSVDRSATVTASWTTTGETLEPPAPPSSFRRATLAVRPWRLAPPPATGAERPLWQLVAVLYTLLAVIVGLVIGAAFLVAYLVTGSAY